jgi:hypothetical protein
MLPSKAHIVIDRVHQNDSFACRYVNPDGTTKGIRLTWGTVTLTIEFVQRYCLRIR